MENKTQDSSVTEATVTTEALQPQELKYPTEFKIKVARDSVKFATDPNNRDIHIIHAYPFIRDFPAGNIPDEVNPRSHERLPGRLAETIEQSLIESPREFHLRNRGVTILAERAAYDEQTEILSFSVPNPSIYGVVDGATTDRVLARMTEDIVEFENLQVNKLPEHFQMGHLHVEILTGDIGEELVPLASARNTSVQVKEFALENLGHGFDWLKDSLVGSEFANRVKFRENDPQPVDVREVLGLLTLFHNRWNIEKREPVVAYAAKGRVLEHYQSEEWRPGYVALRQVVPSILRLYDYVHVSFPKQYEAYKALIGSKARFGMRKEVKYRDKGMFTLPLTQQKTPYLIPDGWLYPILGAFRMLLKQSETEISAWYTDPVRFFDDIGASLVADVVDESEAMNRNPVAVGRARPLWNSLRKSVEMRRLNIQAGTRVENLVGAEQPSQANQVEQPEPERELVAARSETASFDTTDKPKQTRQKRARR